MNSSSTVRRSATGVVAGYARWTGLAGLMLLLVACAAPVPRDAPPAPQQPRTSATSEAPGAAVEEPEADTEEEATPGAALVLAEQARAARQAGNMARAGQRLERALRMAPRDAGLWHRMAVVRFEQGRYQQAERMAQRSLQLGAGGASALALENWRVIAAAREALGDEAGAAAAREEIRRLESGLV